MDIPFPCSVCSDQLFYTAGFAEEVPESPKFPHQFPGEAQDQDLKFVPEEGAGNLKDVLRQPPIGLEANVQVQATS